MKTKRPPTAPSGGPVKQLDAELRKLRAELRATLRTYSARLEIQLAQCRAALESAAAAPEISRERIHALRDLTAMLRKRKVKPEKGRRKDLRKLDELISDVHLFLPGKG